MNERPTQAEYLAQLFHEYYEELAPDFDYKTRRASAVPWPDVPEKNRLLMVAVCQRLLDNHVTLLRQDAVTALTPSNDEVWGMLTELQRAIYGGDMDEAKRQVNFLHSIFQPRGEDGL